MHVCKLPIGHCFRFVIYFTEVKSNLQGTSHQFSCYYKPYKSSLYSILCTVDFLKDHMHSSDKSTFRARQQLHALVLDASCKVKTPIYNVQLGWDIIGYN